MKILYFTRGLPDDAELEEARKNGALLRNRLAWHERDCLESCDLVLGRKENIPSPYLHLWREKPNDELPESQAGGEKGKKRRKNAANC